MQFLLRYIKNLAVVFLLLISFAVIVIAFACFVMWEIPKFALDHSIFPVFRIIIVLSSLITFLLTLDKKI